VKISVITPSFNQAQFLPDNLRTVSGQRTGPEAGVELEHIIVDPGSTDGSTEIARAARHAILMAEPDRGQSHGITKGFARATGDVMTWLNSDDFYPAPDVLAKVAAAFRRHPEADVIYGGVNFVDESGAFLRKGFVNRDAAGLLDSFAWQVGIVQPGMFMRRRVFEAVGGPSEDYTYCMDYEYWVRIAKAGFRWVYLDEVLAHHRWWPGMKTSSGRGDSLIEHFRVGLTYFGYIHHKWLDRYGEFRATDADGVVTHAGEVDAEAKAACVREAIERFVTQDMLAQIEAATDPEQRATAEYIRRMAPGVRRVLFAPAELPGAVSTHPDPHADARPAWCIFDTRTPDGRRFKTYRVPDNFERHFDADWYAREHARALERLEGFRRRRKETCVVVANGPSLNLSNLDLLPRADVIVSNFAIISDRLRAAATYLTMVNDLVARQGAVPFNRLDIPKIVPFWLANAITPGPNAVFVPATVEPKFCGDIDGVFSWRSTVSFFNMQLAFALGYENVVLIGFDHSYQQAPEMKEGTAIVQQTEDPNHFDPRYFQGKTWQAADTGNMEKSYLLVRDAYAAAGRRIVNATVGGKLEVFPRMSLEEALGLPPARARAAVPAATPAPVPAPASAPVPATPAAPAPRLLVLDMTAMGDGTATGEIKATLLAGWPEAALLQVARKGRGLSLVRPAATPGGARFDERPAEPAAVAAAIDAFAPEIVLYRPVPDVPWLHAFAMATIRRLDRPVAVWIMDDWPSRLAADDPAQWQALRPNLEWLLDRAALRLSICTAMSEALEARYGGRFVPLANGVDPADWPAPAPAPRAGAGPGTGLRVRYCGGLAANMTRNSVLRIARAVEGLAAEGHDIRLEINTQTWWEEQSRPLFASLRATTVGTDTLPPRDYVRWLQGADVLVIAYNFDADSLRYVRYSMANKMPECLASGAVLLAHGPREAATIDYLAGTGAAVVVETESEEAVTAALRRLMQAPGERAELAARARALAFSAHDVRRLRTELRGLLAEAAGSGTGAGARSQPAPQTVPQPIAQPAPRPAPQPVARPAAVSPAPAAPVAAPPAAPDIAARETGEEVAARTGRNPEEAWEAIRQRLRRLAPVARMVPGKHVVPGLWLAADTEKGALEAACGPLPGGLMTLRARIRRPGRWLSLNASLGEGALGPDDVLGLVCALRAPRPVPCRLVLRVARPGGFENLPLSDEIAVGPDSAPHVATLSARELPILRRPAEWRNLMLLLPRTDFEIALQDLRLFVLEGDSLRPSAPARPGAEPPAARAAAS